MTNCKNAFETRKCVVDMLERVNNVEDCIAYAGGMLALSDTPQTNNVSIPALRKQCTALAKRFTVEDALTICVPVVNAQVSGWQTVTRQFKTSAPFTAEPAEHATTLPSTHQYNQYIL